MIKLTIIQSIDNWKKSEFKNYFYNIWFNSENKKTCLIINFLTHLFLYPLYIQCRLFISKNFCILYCGLLSIFSVWSFFCLSGCYIIVYAFYWYSVILFSLFVCFPICQLVRSYAQLALVYLVFLEMWSFCFFWRLFSFLIPSVNCSKSLSNCARTICLKTYLHNMGSQKLIRTCGD